MLREVLTFLFAVWCLLLIGCGSSQENESPETLVADPKAEKPVVHWTMDLPETARLQNEMPLAVVCGDFALPPCSGTIVLRLDEASYFDEAMTALSEYSLDRKRSFIIGKGAETVLLAERHADIFSGAIFLFDGTEVDRYPKSSRIFENWLHRKHDVMEMASNLSSVNCYVICIPTEDGSLRTPVLARRLHQALQAAKGNVKLTELTEAPAHEDFVKAIMWCQASAKSGAPESFSWTTFDFGTNGAWWLRAGQPEKPLEPFGFRSSRNGQVVDVVPKNLKSFSVVRHPDWFNPALPIIVNVRSEAGSLLRKVLIPAANVEDDMTMIRQLRNDDARGWLDENYTDIPDMQKDAMVPGGFASVMKSPLVIVPGGEEPEWRKAAVKLATFCRETLGLQSVTVINDGEMTMGMIDGSNVILLGGPEDNEVSRMIYPYLPLPDIFVALAAELAGEVELAAADYLLAYPVDNYPDPRMMIMAGGDAPDVLLNRLLDAVGQDNPLGGCSDCLIYHQGKVVRGVLGTDWSVASARFAIAPESP